MKLLFCSLVTYSKLNAKEKITWDKSVISRIREAYRESPKIIL